MTQYLSILTPSDFLKFLDFLIGFLYLAMILWLALYGINNLINAILYLRIKNTLKSKYRVTPPKQWPQVTIQLPIFNEKYTVERLLKAVTRMDYPQNCLQFQVLDDLTDDTVNLVSALVNIYKSMGVDIECLHRDNRKGYKAGALNEGLSSAKGDLIAIFDADFVPKPDFLRNTVPLFQNPLLGCLQTRWGHTNREYNSLTRAEALAIDGHFIVEQTARSQNDLFLNFNGAAGIWRRVCIEDAGGWEWDTLTEDLDLSYRAQMRGWKIGYTPDIVVPAELPSQVEAFKKQQFRWAKGSFQVVRKILPQVVERNDISWNIRLMAFLHLTGYMVHPLMVCLLLITLPVGLYFPSAFKLFPYSVLAGFGPPFLYLVTDGWQTPSLGERLKLIPLLIITGFGISLSTSIGVFEGLIGNGGNFVRTPKLNQGNIQKQSKRPDRTYIQPISPLVWGEITLGFYSLLTGYILASHNGWGIIPWMMIYTVGYFYIAGLNIIQHATYWDVGILKSFNG